MPIGSVEIALAAGSDFMQAANGDLVLVADAPQAPLATTQRIIRLILTNARIVNQSTGSVSNPDDKFNPKLGSNARASVGSPIDATLITTLQSQILNALAEDPDISAVPAPSVVVTQAALDTVSVTVTCYAITGEIITIPSLPIKVGA